MFTIDESKLIEILARGENETVEFKRLPDIRGLSETICAFANTSGGIIIIGVDDTGKIIGVDLESARKKAFEAISNVRPYPEVNIDSMIIGNKSLLIINVKKSGKMHTYKNIVYMRIGSSNRPLSLEELIEKASESLIIRFDEMPSNAPISAIDTNLIKEFLKRREEIRGIRAKGTLEKNMEKLGIIIKRKNKFQPTNGGLLFFSNEPQLWLPQSKVHLVWFNDDSMTTYKDSRYFTGPIWKMIDEIEEYFYKNLGRIGGELIGWRRVEIVEYPIRALREAITNALTHRNYFDPSEVKIFIFPNKIIIRNPGSFPPGVSIENPIHKPRNPLLAQYMYDIGYIEKYGFGIKMILEECEKHPLVSVEFNIRPYITEVVFMKTRKESMLDDLDRAIVNLLRREGDLSSGEISKKLGKTKPTIIKHLKKLEGLGFVKPKGSGPTRRYSLSKI